MLAGRRSLPGLVASRDSSLQATTACIRLIHWTVAYALRFFSRERFFSCFRPKRLYLTMHRPSWVKKSSSAMKKGNVGLVVALQPWERSSHPTALCVANANLCPLADENNAVQRRQLLMLLRTLESFNADFQLPLVLCGTFNFLPYTEHYNMVVEGMYSEKPKAPSQLALRPTSEAISRTQMVVRWEKPYEGDAPIIGYEIMRRAGGNTIAGFGNPEYFDGGNLPRGYSMPS